MVLSEKSGAVWLVWVGSCLEGQPRRKVRIVVKMIKRITVKGFAFSMVTPFRLRVVLL
jgi:hypothetical protein